MKRRLGSALVAGYLFLCIVLGGSAQGTWGNLALQLLGIGLIAWAAVATRLEGDESRPLGLYVLLVTGLLLVLAQIIPLPPHVWAALPGRTAIADGFSALGYPRPALPISETPFNSVLTVFFAIPAIAAFLATEKLRPSPRWLALAVIAGTLLAILVGALQLAGGRESWAYFYRVTNYGAVGFFANQNHMATLLLVTIPLAAGIMASTSETRRSSAAGRYGLGSTVLALVLVGIALNGSLAAYALAVPVLLASLALLPAAVRWRRFVLPLSAAALVGGVAFVASAPLSTGAFAQGASFSFTSRAQIWAGTSEAIRDTFPAGTGLGSFEQVYRQHEDPLSVTREYVNHAHNDYLELVLELGTAGAILVTLFLLWWAVAAVWIWQSPLSTPFGRASTIATAAVLAHSIVDFPLRTAAISAIFAATIAIMAKDLASAPVRLRGETRPTRHSKIG